MNLNFIGSVGTELRIEIKCTIHVLSKVDSHDGGLSENERLQLFDAVSIITMDSCQVRLAQLCQLSLAELAGV